MILEKFGGSTDLVSFLTKRIKKKGRLKIAWKFVNSSTVKSGAQGRRGSRRVSNDQKGRRQMATRQIKRSPCFILTLLSIVFFFFQSSPALGFWEFFTGGISDLSGVPASPAIGDDGTIYVGSLNGYFYALNPDGT